MRSGAECTAVVGGGSDGGGERTMPEKSKEESEEERRGEAALSQDKVWRAVTAWHVADGLQ